MVPLWSPCGWRSGTGPAAWANLAASTCCWFTLCSAFTWSILKPGVAAGCSEVGLDVLRTQEQRASWSLLQGQPSGGHLSTCGQAAGGSSSVLHPPQGTQVT